MEVLNNIFEPAVASDGTALWATKSSIILDTKQTNETIPLAADTQAQKCMNAVRNQPSVGSVGFSVV